MAKKKVAMWLDTNQIKALKVVSKKTGIPMSVLIRRESALRSYCDEKAGDSSVIRAYRQ
jgi:hypothetical protein